MDELELYDRALSESEIQLIYASPLGKCRQYPFDPNGDGIIDIGDVVLLVNYLFGTGPAPDPLAAGDANCDGVVDIGDVVYLINYLFIEGPPPPY